MHIQHANPHTTTVGHRGHEFTALREGIFNVPDEVGAELLQQPLWSRYHGEAAYEVALPVPSGATLADASGSAAGEAERQRLASVPVPDETDWYEVGRQAAEAGQPRATPPDKHPASRDARDFFRGYDSYKAEPPAAGTSGDASS